jgi:hypothetical protein
MYRRLFAALTVLATFCAFGAPSLAQQPTLAEPQLVVPQTTSTEQQMLVDQAPLVPVADTPVNTDEDRLASVERRIRVIEKQLDLVLQLLELVPTRETYPEFSKAGPSDDTALPTGGSGRIGRIEKRVEGVAGTVQNVEADSQLVKDALVAVQDEVTKVRQDLNAARDHVTPPNSTTPSSPTSASGQLILQNWTGGSQYVLVNGIGYQVPPGRRVLTVPYSILEVYVPRYESAKLWGMTNWKRNGENYEMLVYLRPN